MHTIKKLKSKYPLNQSPFYKVNSHQTLAKILHIDIKTLRKVLDKGIDNYFFSKTTSDKPRELQIPKPQLRRIHSRINNLLSRIESPSYLNSGVKGRSNVKNARAHLGDKALIKVDIKSFYTSTTVEMIEKCFIKTFRCAKDVAKTIAELCCVNGHLPTGSPISQSVSFYVNISVFNHLQSYSKSRKIEFSVYVDDLTFSGQKIPQHFIEYVTSFIKNNRGYECHKIRKYNSVTPKVITGAVIDGNILKVKNTHRKIIFDLLRSRKANMMKYNRNSPELVNYFQVLIGHLFSAGQINGRYYQLGKAMTEYRKKHEIKSLN